MSYLLVNDDLRILSCSADDIHHEDTESISVLYNFSTDQVFINREHPDHDIIQPIVIKYLRSDLCKKQDIRYKAGIIAGNKLNEIFDVLDKVIAIREQKA
jgi:hypothetical protein